MDRIKDRIIERVGMFLRVSSKGLSKRYMLAGLGLRLGQLGESGWGFVGGNYILRYPLCHFGEDVGLR